jgi:hypothetical protein
MEGLELLGKMEGLDDCLDETCHHGEGQGPQFWDELTKEEKKGKIKNEI